MFKNALCSCLLGVALAVLMLTPTIHAQTTFGSIVVTITDSSGAVVADTQVTLINLGTNEKRTGTTNAEGLYQFVNVQPGNYSVYVEKAGFKRVVRTPVTVETATTTRIDLAL